MHIRTSAKGVKTLAHELNLNPATVRKWRGRESPQDASHRPHNLRTMLSPAQAAMVVELRRTVLLSLDDLVAVTQAHINPDASRAGLGRFDRGCRALGAEHRLIPPGHPQTNGMVERFNGRVAAILGATQFRTAAELSTALSHYPRLYNEQIPRAEKQRSAA